MFFFRYIQNHKIITFIIISLFFAIIVAFTHYKSLYYFNLSDEFKIENSNYKITKFTSNEPIDRGYFEIYKNKLFLITGDGNLFFMPIKKINKKKLIFKKIKSNFKDIVGVGYAKDFEKKIVKNILIKNNRIYVSFAKRVNEKCYMNSILVSDFDLHKILFKEFFKTNECSLHDSLSSGGNLHSYKKNTILMTIGDWDYAEKYKINRAQDPKSLFGKTIAIREKTKEYKILSMGHRNQQGLFYDKKNDIIYSTEHGPKGGDEININISPENFKMKNYGWPMSSYGEHYGYPDDELGSICQCPLNELYKEIPLYQSHSSYGFIEPLINFTPSIGITQIIKTEDFLNMPNKNIVYISSLGWSNSIGTSSVHELILSKDFKIEKHGIIPFRSRIRDLIYIKKLNAIVVFLESAGTIGILKND